MNHAAGNPRRTGSFYAYEHRFPAIDGIYILFNALGKQKILRVQANHPGSCGIADKDCAFRHIRRVPCQFLEPLGLRHGVNRFHLYQGRRETKAAGFPFANP